MHSLFFDTLCMSKLKEISYSFIFPERLKLSRKKYFTSALKPDRHHVFEMPETNFIFIFICEISTNNKTVQEDKYAMLSDKIKIMHSWIKRFMLLYFILLKNIMRNLSAKNLASKVTWYLKWQQGNATLNGMCILLQFSMFQEEFKL